MRSGSIHLRSCATPREGWISATSENITLHIDMNARKVAAFPADIQARIRDVVNSHAGLSRPEGIGRKVTMPSKK